MLILLLLLKTYDNVKTNQKYSSMYKTIVLDWTQIDNKQKKDEVVIKETTDHGYISGIHG